MPNQDGSPTLTDQARIVVVDRTMLNQGLYSGSDVAPEDVLSVYVVVNGPLGMSPGKVAAQSFHAGRRAESYAYHAPTDHPWVFWHEQGKRVVLRVAETPHVFDRVVDECEGFAHHDEGLTEVERGATTVYVTRPYRRDEVPQILRHKRCQLL